jgi:hypothetical protein
LFGDYIPWFSAGPGCGTCALNYDTLIFMEDKNMAAKPDAKSGYITLPAPYFVFTKE